MKCAVGIYVNEVANGQEILVVGVLNSERHEATKGKTGRYTQASTASIVHKELITCRLGRNHVA